MDPKLPPSGKSLCDIMDPNLAHSCGPMVNTSDYGPSGGGGGFLYGKMVGVLIISFRV